MMSRFLTIILLFLTIDTALRHDCHSYAEMSWYSTSSGICYTFDPSEVVTVTTSMTPAIDYCKTDAPGLLLSLRKLNSYHLFPTHGGQFYKPNKCVSSFTQFHLFFLFSVVRLTVASLLYHHVRSAISSQWKDIWRSSPSSACPGRANCKLKNPIIRGFLTMNGGRYRTWSGILSVTNRRIKILRLSVTWTETQTTDFMTRVTSTGERFVNLVMSLLVSVINRVILLDSTHTSTHQAAEFEFTADNTMFNSVESLDTSTVATEKECLSWLLLDLQNDSSTYSFMLASTAVRESDVHLFERAVHSIWRSRSWFVNRFRR